MPMRAPSSRDVCEIDRLMELAFHRYEDEITVVVVEKQLAQKGEHALINEAR